MASNFVFMGAALLIAAPLFPQNALPAWADLQVKEGSVEPVWFQLTEDREQVGRMLGKPVQIVETGKAFFSWQYQLDSADEDYSHYAVFRKSDGKLISVTRQFAKERLVDEFFPDAETVVCHYPDAVKPVFGVRVRRLPGGRLLIAMGSAKRGAVTGQLMLIRENELGNFYPWIQVQLDAKP